LQSYLKIPTIYKTLEQPIAQLSHSTEPPAIQGYYASISEDLDKSQHKAFFHQQYTLFDLLCTGLQLQIAIFKYRNKIDNEIITMFQKKLTSQKWTTNTQTIDFEAHLDQVGGSVTCLFAFNSNYYTSTVDTASHLQASPPIPNGFHKSIYEPFNSSTYGIPTDKADCFVAFRLIKIVIKGNRQLHQQSRCVARQRQI
jgi:hypothetical protein